RHTRLQGDWSSDVCSSDLVPTEAPRPLEIEAKPQLTITSEPNGAEIEIDGEFIGNAPTTTTVKHGKVVVKVKKAGFQPWERTLKIGRASCRKECRSRGRTG